MNADAARNMERDAAALLVFFEDANDEVHEPDNQGFRFLGVVGTSFDNCCGSHISVEAIQKGFQNAVVVFEQEKAPKNDNDEFTLPKCQFNLATLVALARHGAQCMMRSQGVLGEVSN